MEKKAQCGQSHSTAVSIGVLVRHFGGILLVKYGAGPADALWQLPRGELRWQESMPRAVERVVMEQAGVHVVSGGILEAYDLIQAPTNDTAGSHRVVLNFEADYRDGDLRAGEGILDVAWASGVALRSMTVEENSAELLSDMGLM